MKKHKIYVDGREIFPQEHTLIAVVELDWGEKTESRPHGRTLHDVVNEAKILNVCDLSEMKSQLGFSSTTATEWNFWASGFSIFKYSEKEAVAVIIDHDFHLREDYQLFRYHIAVFQRKAKLEKIKNI